MGSLHELAVDTWARTLPSAALLARDVRCPPRDGRINVVRCPGVEPGSLAWEANILTVGPTTPHTPHYDKEHVVVIHRRRVSRLEGLVRRWMTSGPLSSAG